MALGSNRRRTAADEHGGGGGGHEGAGMMRWLLTYADMITLLNVFFIILYAQSKVDREKFSQLAVSLAEAFNVGVMLGQQSTGYVLGRGGRFGTIELAPYQRIADEIGQFASQQGLTEEISVGLRREGVVVRFSGSLLFPSGQAELTPEGREVLHRLAYALRTTPGHVQIEGHTDNLPFSSPQYPSNWELSTARAAAVLRYFLEVEGLPADRFSIAGYADLRPVAPNDTRENRARNRRIEVFIQTPETSPR